MTFQHWILDFDETLLKGWDALAMEIIFPSLIQKYNLSGDRKKLNQAIMDAQAKSVSNSDTQFLLKGIFNKMKWSQELIVPFLAQIQSQYQPKLFDDTLPFLRRLYESHKKIYILSNNPLTQKYAKNLGVLSYVEAVFTPDILPDNLRKPDTKLWDHLQMYQPNLKIETTTMVGDDPWTDGAFAEACGLTCWIVDRHERYQELYKEKPHKWITSLNEIKVTT